MLRAVGQLDQFAKETFALETAAVTHGAAAWQIPPELNMSEVRLDGLLVVQAPALLATLAAPWSSIGQPGELVMEIKMPGDHLDMIAVHRAELRRLARQVQRHEDPHAAWDGEEPLWIVAPHLPAILGSRRTLERIGPGCYRVGPLPHTFLWIAANELPLVDELVPFLIARSGRALDAFVGWVKTRRPIPWLLRVLEFLPMSTPAFDDLHLYTIQKTDDPGRLARRRMFLEWMLEAVPERREELVHEGELKAERSSLRRVLTARGIALSAEDDARIDACTDLDTLGRWIDQAAVAASVVEALR
jgi:hypothetical protein